MSNNKKATVITVGSTKGGVYKTTTAIHLAAYLSKFRGKKVLLVDCDHIQSVTLYFNYEESRYGLSDVIKNGSTEGAITHLPDVGFDLLYNDDSDGDNEDALRKRFGDASFVLDKALKNTARSEYDFIILDTNPNSYKMFEAAIVASDIVLTPVVLEMMAARELYRKTVPLIAQLRERLADYMTRDFARHAAFFVQVKDNVKYAPQVSEMVYQLHDEFDSDLNVIDVTIKNRVIYQEAVFRATSVFHLEDPSTKKIERWYSDIADSLLAMIDDGGASNG